MKTQAQINQYQRERRERMREAYNEYQRIYRKARITRPEIVKEVYDALPSDAIEIPLYPTYYATPNGDIWRISQPKTNKFGTIPSRIIKISQLKNSHVPYLQCQPYINGKKQLVYSHKLILLAFKGIPQYGFSFCNHIDGNTFNNNINNLEWVSRQQNNERKVNPRGKFSHLKNSCLADYDAGMKIVDIVKKYDMKSSHHIYGWLKFRKNKNNLAGT
jgi:hypothetical protein